MFINEESLTIECRGCGLLFDEECSIPDTPYYYCPYCGEENTEKNRLRKEKQK